MARSNNLTTDRTTIAAFGTALVTLLLTLGLIGGTSAALTKKQMQEEINSFHSFLNEHPKISTELQANPALAGNKKYLDKHEDLKKYFKQHPAMQNEVINHPRNVFASRRNR
jgi:uncharacterized protein YneF (UPF0154 family)